MSTCLDTVKCQLCVIRAREGRGASEGQALWRDEEVLARTAFRLDLGYCAVGLAHSVCRLSTENIH